LNSNALPHDYLLYNNLSHNYLLFNNLLSNDLLYNYLLHNYLLYNNLLHNNPLHNYLLCNNLLHNNPLYNYLLYNNLLYNDLLHNYLLHNYLLHNNPLHIDLLCNNLLYNDLLHNYLLHTNPLHDYLLYYLRSAVCPPGKGARPIGQGARGSAAAFNVHKSCPPRSSTIFLFNLFPNTTYTPSLDRTVSSCALDPSPCRPARRFPSSASPQRENLDDAFGLEPERRSHTPESILSMVVTAILPLESAEPVAMRA
jgi:hypothetical protein